MIVKKLLLFFIVCGMSAVCILLGSVVGHVLGKIGLFSGAFVGGIAGVALGVWLSARVALLDKQESQVTFIGGTVGFIVAALLTVTNLQGPLIPMASVAFIGFGAVIGKMFAEKRAA